MVERIISVDLLLFQDWDQGCSPKEGDGGTPIDEWRIRQKGFVLCLKLLYVHKLQQNFYNKLKIVVFSSDTEINTDRESSQRTNRWFQTNIPSNFSKSFVQHFTRTHLYF